MQRRYEFIKWAAEWCKVAGDGQLSLCGLSGVVAGNAVIEVLEWAAFRHHKRTVSLAPGDVAEVCHYVPNGRRLAYRLKFDDNGDLLVESLD